MAIPSSYFASTKNLAQILDQVQRGRVPPKFTYDFLKLLGFPSSNDRPIIPVLKALGFLDVSGVPQERYRRYKDPSQAKRVMAEGIREAYADVFVIDEKAHDLSSEKVRGIFARLSDKSEIVTERMAMTFRALSEHADFSQPSEEPTTEDEANEKKASDVEPKESSAGPSLSLRHDIHIHLPQSDDIKVYDAIFRSLREQLSL
jgi:Family of unknown function (DUF5343)